MNKNISPESPSTESQPGGVEEQSMVSTKNEIGTWAQLAESLYDFLNRRSTTIEYNFMDLEVMVPEGTGTDSTQARWKFNGAVRLRTWEGNHQR